MSQDVKQLSRRDLMALGTEAARAELQARNDRVRAGREVIAAMKARLNLKRG